jgi:uncharacterized heparinase superfamily protein
MSDQDDTPKAERGQIEAGQIEAGKRLVRVEDKGMSIGERIVNRFYRLTWRTPLHAMRLKGRYPLKLLAVPTDPMPGNRKAGQAMLDGTLRYLGDSIATDAISFGDEGWHAASSDWLQRFAWLRDLAAAGARAPSARIAEATTRRWLAQHSETVSNAAWRPDLVGWRTLFWTAHAPLILSSTDQVYRSTVLNTLARGVRHLDRVADRAAEGNGRIAAWAGIVTAGLLIPGGDPRLSFGQLGLQRALLSGTSEDGGSVSRSPLDQLELVELLAMIAAAYDARGFDVPEWLKTALSRAVGALLGIAMNDGALSSWQGSGPIAAARVETVVAASGVRTRPLRQARDWGYQRLQCGNSVVIVDAAPPPSSRIGGGSCPSTLAFELCDGDKRIVVNCGGSRGAQPLPDDFMTGLRATAAHSTLTLADSNSTAINPDGTLGAGVRSMELDRAEMEGGSRIEVSHDGYAKRFGLIHKRLLTLSANGRELRGEDTLAPAPRRKTADTGFAIRFHMGPGIEIVPTADGLAALLRVEQGPLWQFRCKGGSLSIEDSVWIDGFGRAHTTQQMIVSGEAPAGGTTIGWMLKRAG